jgi:predicted phosphodiesterase
MSKWTKREEDTALFLYHNENKNYKEVAEQLTRYYGVVRTAEAVRKKIRLSQIDLEEIERPIELDLGVGSYPASHKLDRWHDDYAQSIEIEEAYQSETEDLMGLIGKPRHGKTQYKVACISDLHLAHMDTKAFQTFLDQNKDADVIVINGDINDNDAVSYWAKKNPIMPLLQYQRCRKLAMILERLGILIVWTSGNHDEWFWKYFLERVDFFTLPFVNTDLINLVLEGYDICWDEETEEDDNEFFTYHNLPVKKSYKPAHLVKGEPIKNSIYKNNANNWWVKVGHALFTHAHKYLGSAPLKTCLAIDANFQQHPIYYEAIIQAHTHKQGKAIHGKKLLMESGCCCHAPAYAAGPKCKYGPQVVGWSNIFLDVKGHVDFNKSNNIYYGSTSSILR